MKKIIAIACLVLAAAAAYADWKDGTYTAKEAQADARGYVAEIRITVTGGKIAKVEYNEAKKGASKWKDASYNASMKKIGGIAWTDAVTAAYEGLIAKQDPAAMDAISGATEMQKRFKTLAAEALAKAKK